LLKEIAGRARGLPPEVELQLGLCRGTQVSD
jgi:hypothetical protein